MRNGKPEDPVSRKPSCAMQVQIFTCTVSSKLYYKLNEVFYHSNSHYAICGNVLVATNYSNFIPVIKLAEIRRIFDVAFDKRVTRTRETLHWLGWEYA